ncbi:MAG: DUF1501 domain-containing protein, partial [Verrucomicrobia bacterium]|nr:DUF1501 domain-containing protein [Verrucomicrobiota bacterium]
MKGSCATDLSIKYCQNNPMESLNRYVQELNRRTFLSRASMGLGAAALHALSKPSLLSASSRQSPNMPGIDGFPDLPVKAKRVIFLCMAGGPSHLETFDPKPTLARLDGQPMPESFTQGQPIAQLQGKELKCLGPQTQFSKYGQSGQEISDFLPWTAKMADEIAIVRSMVTDQINHDPAHTVMNTGTSISGRPSMGAWINYGLG